MDFFKKLFKSKKEKQFEKNKLKIQAYKVYCKNIFTRQIKIYYLKDYKELPFYLKKHSPNNNTPTFIDGNVKHYYKNDKKHRDNDLPAFEPIDETISSSVYYQYGDRHRENGPAIFFPNGTYKFYLYGIEYDDIKDWLKDHPNQDKVFQAKMILQYS